MDSTLAKLEFLPDPAFRRALQAARGQQRAGGGAVLDILLRGAGHDSKPHVRQQCELAGVRVLESESDGELRPDFSRWDGPTARTHRAVVLTDAGSQQLLAAEDPWDEKLLNKVASRIGHHPIPVAVRTERLKHWLGDAVEIQAGSNAPSAGLSVADGPIVQFVDQAIQAAFNLGASDVHFECDRSGVTAKHRLDGVMASFARLAGSGLAQEVISRIKVLAQLDITERRLPQDGRFRFGLIGSEVDLRVSIMPSVHGEDAVLRLLDKAQLRAKDAAVSLDSLGFPEQDAALLRDLASAPSGMLLITGPTGSGKTTTVYAALSEINTGLEKIITIEDPVEYELAGVLQIPVNERKGLTFAKGLRSILRHDPDRILVGEIRDSETADIAVQSALTGHLVFTTVHANSLADVVGRFRHFGLDMFGFMSSLNGLVVQRLVRRLCTQCRDVRPLSEAERVLSAKVGRDLSSRTMHAVGCAACNGSGYRGRFVLAEVHRIDDALRDCVTEGAALSVLKEHSRIKGVRPLLDLAFDAVEDGKTTLEEIRRVVGWY